MWLYIRTLCDGSCSAAAAVVCRSKYFCVVIAAAHHMLLDAAVLLYVAAALVPTVMLVLILSSLGGRCWGLLLRTAPWSKQRYSEHMDYICTRIMTALLSFSCIMLVYTRYINKVTDM